MGRKGRVKRKNRERMHLRSPIFLIALLCLCGALIVFVGTYFWQPQPSPPAADPSRAVLVDGIGLTKPNPDFIAGVKDVLNRSGLKLDIYEGSEVTIDLLENLAGYGLIILRLHSAVEEEFRLLYIFSAEPYNESEISRFGDEWGPIVRQAITFDNESYFALRADTLGYKNERESLRGAVIILMGCNGTDGKTTIQKLFVDRGVKAVIAWDGYVDLDYTDEITLLLLKTVYEDKIEFKDAVEKLMKEKGPDPIWGSRLKYLTPSNK